VTTTEVEASEDFVVSHLTLQRENCDDSPRRICHFQFVSWPDYGVPDSAVSMLHFLQVTKTKKSAI